MSLLDALLARLRSLLPGEEPAEPADEDATAADRAYQCTICGTPAEDPEGECPLCGSTDLARVDEMRDGNPEDGTLEGDIARESTAEAAPTVGEALAERDPLAAYADRWERSGDGTAPYRVALPDGGVTHAGTREEVRSLLFEHYGPPGDG